VNTVTRTIPLAGTQVPQGSKVDLDISVGSRRQKWWENTSSFIFSVLGIITLLTLLAVLAVSLFTHNGPLEELGNLEIARGLITFLIAFTTVGIALILTISTVVAQDSQENDKRFDRGKQVLTTLIGVLGTIVGFYFAASKEQECRHRLPRSPRRSYRVGRLARSTPIRNLWNPEVSHLSNGKQMGCQKASC
jgi:hypothetical protein